MLFPLLATQTCELHPVYIHDVLPILSEPVSLSGGNAVLHLSNGVDLTAATVTGGNQLHFTYTVAAGHDTSDVRINSFTPATQGTLQEPAANNASLSSTATAVALSVDT